MCFVVICNAYDFSNGFSRLVRILHMNGADALRRVTRV